MDWRATGDSGTGGQLGRGHGLPRPPGLPDDFGHGGPWETAVPSAALAAALEQAAGPEERYDSADTDALVGIARQWAAGESWAAAAFRPAAARSAAPGWDTFPRASGSGLIAVRPDLP